MGRGTILVVSHQSLPEEAFIIHCVVPGLDYTHSIIDGIYRDLLVHVFISCKGIIGGILVNPIYRCLVNGYFRYKCNSFFVS